MKTAIVGADLSGAVISRELAEFGHECTVFDTRDHIAGNCHSERDKETNVMLHVYGPHVFHTDDTEVWQYVSRVGNFKPYVNHVKAFSNGGAYSLPVNFHTINQFFGKALKPTEAKGFLENLADKKLLSLKILKNKL